MPHQLGFSIKQLIKASVSFAERRQLVAHNFPPEELAEFGIDNPGAWAALYLEPGCWAAMRARAPVSESDSLPLRHATPCFPRPVLLCPVVA